MQWQNLNAKTLRNPNVSQPAKEVLKQLISVERQGNVEAVLVFIKNQSKM
ncbi:MAG: hypothetical protein KF760_24005 [Candidatus Eremiobacteraeota bacterium]|nr:hypothetical protein [Candidatus Eremiobacteraeota bacterium]MCW5866582.1 hypothetical protein [Candidatus Eremiobacteraeota bacterium]